MSEPSEEARIQAAIQAYKKERDAGSGAVPMIKDDELAVAVTRDGKVYIGRAVGQSKIRNKYIEKLIWWVGKAHAFFFMRVLRLPYLMDLMRGNRKNNTPK